MDKAKRILKRDALLYRKAIKNHYESKYFNLFISSYDIIGAEREERDFILRQVWKRGTICSFRITDEILGFAPFAPQNFNMYGTPTEVNVINLRGVPYLPSKPLKTGTMRINQARRVDEPEVVLGWGLPSMMPIREMLSPIIDQIVETEMTIRTNLFQQKMPRITATTPENKNKIAMMIDEIESDETNVFVDSLDMDAIASIDNSSPYIIDRLRNHVNELDNLVLTFIGIDNDGKQKLQRENVDETNSNNALIDAFGDNCVGDCLRQFLKKTNEAFGTELRLVRKMKAVDSFHDKEKKGSDENGNPNDDPDLSERAS